MFKTYTIRKIKQLNIKQSYFELIYLLNRKDMKTKNAVSHAIQSENPRAYNENSIFIPSRENHG